MKYLITILLISLAQSISGQNYPFVKDFIGGAIVFKDSTQKTGQLKWFPNPNEKLQFRESESGHIKKYSPEDLLGFSSDKFRFISLHGLDIYAANYGLTGKTTHIKHSFGELLHSGQYNIYLVIETGYDALAGGVRAYPNFVFEKMENGAPQYAAFPDGTRMREKRYEQAKAPLYIFFKDYPVIIEKIKSWQRQDDFSEIISLMKQNN